MIEDRTREMSAGPGVVYFAHGQESGPWGTKIQALADIAQARGLAVDSPDYSDLVHDAEARAERLRKLLAETRKPVVLVGSSMGGWVSVRRAGDPGVVGLFLMAPAFEMPGHPRLSLQGKDVPTMIVHGWDDEVVPVDESLKAAREAGVSLLLLPDGHRLTPSLSVIEHHFSSFLEALGW